MKQKFEYEVELSGLLQDEDETKRIPAGTRWNWIQTKQKGKKAYCRRVKHNASQSEVGNGYMPKHFNPRFSKQGLMAFPVSECCLV